MAEPGFFGSLTQGMQSPLFLGGAGILMGGGYQGMNQGIQAGILGERQKFEQQQQQQDRMRQQQQDAENMRRWNTTDKRAADLHPGAMDMQKAQTHWYNGRANAQDALANVRDGRPAPAAPDPLNGWGQDADGNLVPPRGPAIPPQNRPPGIVGAPAGIPNDIAPRMAGDQGVGRFSAPVSPYGPTGVQTTNVPGIVVDDKGKVSDTATRSLAGQSAIDSKDQDGQRRLQDYYRNQQMWSMIQGKAPTGYSYNEKGGLEDLKNKNTATERASRMHAESGIKTLRTAEDILGKSGVIAQMAGDSYAIPGTGVKVGGFGEAGRGFRAAESAVLQLNFALSGKSVSNAEREHFMRIYMPSAYETRDTQQFKIKQVREFFQTVLDARKRGMDDDKIAELYRQKLAEGTVGPEPEQKVMKSGKYRYDPATGGMVPQ